MCHWKAAWQIGQLLFYCTLWLQACGSYTTTPVGSTAAEYFCHHRWQPVIWPYDAFISWESFLRLSHPRQTSVACWSALSPAETSPTRISGGGGATAVGVSPALQAHEELITLHPHHVSVSVPDGNYYTLQILQETRWPHKCWHFYVQPLGHLCANCVVSHYANFKRLLWFVTQKMLNSTIIKEILRYVS